MSYDQTRYAFVDTETTGLDPKIHQVWEIAIIADGIDHVWQIGGAPWRVDLEALTLNRMAERFDPATAVSSGKFVADAILLLAGRHIVGANPGFDIAFLTPLFELSFQTPPWHYRPICVESLAMGATGQYVKGLGGAAEALGQWYDANAHHDALYDAQLAKAIFEAVMGDPE